MLNAFATPQIFVSGRILNAVGFDPDELFIKYKIIIGPNFEKINGVLYGETFQAIACSEDNINVVNFDQPLSFNLKCSGIKGWPKIFVEVFANDKDGRNCLIGYGTGYIPVRSGCNKMTINCWRPSGSTKEGLGEMLLGTNMEFVDVSAVYGTVEKFGVCSQSTGQVNLEVDVILKDFILHGIDI